MELSFIVPNDLSKLPIRDVVAFGRDAGFDRVDARIDRLDEYVEAADAVGMKVGIAMGVASGTLSQDPAERAQGVARAKAAVDAAAAVGLPILMPSTGAPTTDSAANFAAFEETYPQFVPYAADKCVTIAFENCPHGGKGIGYSPEWWRRMFGRVPEDNFGLVFDPSHLYWLGIDYLRALKEFASRLRYVHAKDAQLLHEGQYEYGILGRQFESPKLGPPSWIRQGWWCYRLPGRGSVDWEALFAVLAELGYDGVVSLEHEDPDFEGSADKAKEGLRRGAEYLRRFVK